MSSATAHSNPPTPSQPPAAAFVDPTTQHHPLTLAFAVAALQNGVVTHGGGSGGSAFASSSSASDAGALMSTSQRGTATTATMPPPSIYSATTAPPSHTNTMSSSTFSYANATNSANLTAATSTGLMAPPAHIIVNTMTTSTNPTAPTGKKPKSSKENSNVANEQQRRRHGDNDNDVDIDDEEDEDNAEKRLARSRERNREHARRTRLRKKAQLEALQSKVKTLEEERQTLKQAIEKCGIASILLNLSAGSSSPGAADGGMDEATMIDKCWSSSDDSKTTAFTEALLAAGGKRKRFLSDAMGEHMKSMLQQQTTVKLSFADGQDSTLTLIRGANNSSARDGSDGTAGGNHHHQQQQQHSVAKGSVNWKTGVYTTEDGTQRQLTPDQLESLRRERNRMHAKMTRDRKKCFIATIQKTIEDLENENHRMRRVLAKLATTSMVPLKAEETNDPAPSRGASANPEPASKTGDVVVASMVTPIASPHLGSSAAPPCLSQHHPVPASVTNVSTNESSSDCSSSATTSFYSTIEREPLAKQPRISHGFSLND